MAITASYDIIILFILLVTTITLNPSKTNMKKMINAISS